MAAYKLTASVDSCKQHGEIERFISESPLLLPRVKLAFAYTDYSPSYIGDFDEHDYDCVKALSVQFPDVSFRLAEVDYERDPEALLLFTYENGVET